MLGPGFRYTELVQCKHNKVYFPRIGEPIRIDYVTSHVTSITVLFFFLLKFNKRYPDPNDD